MHIVGSNGQPLNKPQASCTVKMDGKTRIFKDFVVVGIEGEKISIAHNADAITLGIAVQVVKDHFMENYKTLDEVSKGVVDRFFAADPTQEN